QASLLFLLASGLTLVVLTAGLDLSVGANVGLSACLAATLMKSTGSVTLAVVAGASRGCLWCVPRCPPASLSPPPPSLAPPGTSWTLQGVPHWFMKGDTIPGSPPAFRALGSGYWLGVPVPVYLMAAFLAAGVIVAQRTPWGQELYALGANAEAARLSGVPV